MQSPLAKWIPGYASLYYISLALVAASVPLSRYTTSMFQMSAVFFWFWHGVDTKILSHYRKSSAQRPVGIFLFTVKTIAEIGRAFWEKVKVFLSDRAALAVASIFVMHIAGLLYTTDFDYAAKDLRTKIPLLLLPLLLSSGPKIDNTVFRRIIAVYIAAVLAGCIYRLYLFYSLPVADVRAIEAHTSHIRFSLNAVLAVFFLLFYGIADNALKPSVRAAALLAAALIAVFLWFMDYTTGMLMLGIAGMVFLVITGLRIKNRALKLSLFSAMFLLAAVSLWNVISMTRHHFNVQPVDFAALEKTTSAGNSYYHDTVNFKTRNGQWLGLYICDRELRQGWAERSVLPLDSLGPDRQLLRYTLIRYMAAKGLRKDLDGISKLTANDVRLISSGIANPPAGRLASLRNQYEDFLTSVQRYADTRDANAGSMVQRFEYWRVSLRIIRQHPLAGVGTGDVPAAFSSEYDRMHSKLSPQFRLRSHNQYLSIAVGFGILGLLWFLAVMLYPGIIRKGFNNYFYLFFWIIMMASMLTEDTIESQEGVTFYAFFTAFLLFGRAAYESSELIAGGKLMEDKSAGN